MTDINQLVNSIKQATDHQVNKRILREKIQTDLHFAHNGGLFKATPELIAFLNSWTSQEIYLEDTYQNPIKVDRVEMLNLIQQHYQLIMNRWHIEYEELKRVRKI